jgi:hypothetical protein
MSLRVRFISVVFIALLWGCGSGDHPRPLSPDQFYAPQGIGAQPLSGYDLPGEIPPRDTQNEPPAAPLAAGGFNGGYSSPAPASLQERTQGGLAIRTTTRPATQPSGYSAGYPTGQYLTLGTVVAVVGETPIYANDVIRRDAPILREYAREYDADRFEIAARERIDETTHELVVNQLQYDAALKALDNSDKENADRLTNMWRQRQITEAGGSLEVARRRAQAQGEDFNQQVEDMHRFYLVQIYEARDIMPQVQVTASDKRRYYQTHLATDFSTPDHATVWIINTDPSDLGHDLALSKIEGFRKRGLAGEDFAVMAKSQSSSVFTEPKDIERNSFALTKVEAAIWTLQPGQISNVIEDQGGFYIVKMISLEKGGVRPFEDEAVQDEITRTLRTQQLGKLNEEMMNRMLENAVVRTDPEMVDAAVDMVMQNYAKWSQK